MKKVAALSVLALLGAAIAVNAPPAAATDISLESRTYVPARGTDGGNTHVLLYEYLTLDAEDLGTAGPVPAGRRLGQDRPGRRNLRPKDQRRAPVRLPRLARAAAQRRGPPRARLAHRRGGAQRGFRRPAARQRPAGRVRRHAFRRRSGGDRRPTDAPATPSTAARVSQGRAGLYRIGASYLKEENAGSDVARRGGGGRLSRPAAARRGDGQFAVQRYRQGVGPARLPPCARALRPSGSGSRPPGRPPTTGTTSSRRCTRRSCRRTRRPTRSSTRSAARSRSSSAGASRSPASTPRTPYDIAGAAKCLRRRSRLGRLGHHGRRRLPAGARRRGGEPLPGVQRVRHGGRSAPSASPRAPSTWPTRKRSTARRTRRPGTLSLSYAASRSLELSASVEYGQTPEYDREVKGLLAVTLAL